MWAWLRGRSPGQEHCRTLSRALITLWGGSLPSAVQTAETLAWLVTATLSLSLDDSGDDDEEPAAPGDKSELHHTLKNLSLKLNDLSTCNDLIAKHGAALQRSLNELDSLKIPSESGEKLKAVNERATLFRITSNAMINVSAPTARLPGRGGAPHQRQVPERVGA